LTIHRQAARRDANEPAIVETLKRAGARVRRISTPCDLLVVYRGRMATIEVKDGTLAPSDRRETKGEVEWAKDCAAMGAPHYVVTSVDGALAALAALAQGRLTT